MSNVTLYVGTYNKYNCGSLFGKWVDLLQFSDLSEFYQSIQKLHKDEDDPEFMFQDYECPKLFEYLDLIGESYLAPNIYEVMEAIEQSDFSIEILEAFVDCFGSVSDIEELISKVEESYQGEYDSDIEFTQELLKQTEPSLDSIPSYIHIDWEGTARDIMMDYSSSGGFYFRSI